MKKTTKILSCLLIFAMFATACTNKGVDDIVESSTDSTTANESETENTTVEPYEFNYDGSAIGEGIGVNPGRVVWAYNDEAFIWNGSGTWYKEKYFNYDIVYDMLSEAICSLASKDNVNDALVALFINFNERVNGVSESYQSGQKIAIKGNMNTTANGDEDSNEHTSGYFPAPVTVKALLTILVRYGIQPSDITFYDTSRSVPKYIRDICSDGELEGVNIASLSSDYESLVDTTKPITWSRDFSLDYHPDYNGYSTMCTTYFPTFVTEADYLINLFNLRGHTLAGFTASAKNHYGSIIPGDTDEDGNVTFPDALRLNPPVFAGIHSYISCKDYFDNPPELWTCPKREYGTYTPLVDLMANKDCGGKTFLYLCDALSATTNQGIDMTEDEKWYSAPFGDGTGNERGWTNSYFVSQDPVAIDSVCLDFIEAEQRLANSLGDHKWDTWLPEGNTADNYLIEAALADNPPSGTYYQNGYGEHLSSLGTHERWNNDTDRQYSRNLGKDEGIELIKLFDE